MNSELIILTEENATEALVELAFNSILGLHYEGDSAKVRKLIAAQTRKILLAKRQA